MLLVSGFFVAKNRNLQSLFRLSIFAIMAIQNIRIKYVTDTGDLAKAGTALDKLTDSEKKLQKEFDGANSSMKKNFKDTEKEADNLNKTLKSLGGAIGGYFAVSNVISFGKEIINIRGEFQKLEAILTNTLGNSGLAKTALNNIKNFAAETNFSVLELTNAFVKLANRGFVPTIEEMRKLGDVANSTGKTFDQLSEAILDAGTFEFERMKEFGIKMKKHGDMISANFKGQTVEIKATEAAVQQYVLSLGDLNGVKGSTEAISTTLAGQMSNLGDAYDSMLNSWGRSWQKFFGGMLSGVKTLIDGWRDLIKSDEESGEEQSLNIKAKIAEKANFETDLNLQSKFLKDKSEAYKKVFNEQATQEQLLEYQSFAKKNDIRKKAREEVLALAKQDLADVGKGAKALSISEELSQKSALRDKIAFLEESINKDSDLMNLELEDLKKANAKKAEERKKARDKEYQDALALLAKQEALAKREAELNNTPTNDLIGREDSAKENALQILQVEEDFNIKRIQLSKDYNNKNAEDAHNLALVFREIEKQRTELLKEETSVRQTVEEKALADAKRRIEEQTKAEEDMYDAFEKFAKEDLDKNKEIQDQKKQDAIMIAGEMMQGIGMIYNEFKATSDAQRDIERDENRIAERQELEAVKGNKQAEANIKAKYDQIERKAKYDQAVANKQQALFQIGLSTAEAVMRALAAGAGTPVGYTMAAIAAGFGAAQLAIVASRPLPKYAKGVEMLTGEGTETSDSILAKLSKGERVVTAKENRDYYPALTAIHNRQIPPEVLNGFVQNGETGGKVSVFVQQDATLANEVKLMSQKLDKLKQVNITIDKQGVNAFVKSEFGKTELANSYVSL